MKHLRNTDRFRFWRAIALAAFVASLATSAMFAADPAAEAMKSRLASTSIGDRPHLCVQIAERQMAETSKFYAAAEDEKAQPTLTDVIQSHKYQKQTEIAVRGMTRKLTEILHTLGHDDQAPVQDAVKRLQRVRDDLLSAMFKKGAK